MLKEIFFWLFNFYFNSITSVGFEKKMMLIISLDRSSAIFYITIMEDLLKFKVRGMNGPAGEISKRLCNIIM